MTNAPIQLRPVHARDFQILRRLDSPVWRRFQLGLRGEQTPENLTPFTATEAAELIFQFSTPVRDVDETLRRGRGHFRFAAAKAINFSNEAVQTQLIGQITAAIVAFAESGGLTP